MNLTIRQSDKILILGDYQTGKTTFGEWLCARIGRHLTWDPTFAFKEGTSNFEEFKRAFEKTGKGVFQPRSPKAEFGPFCRYAITCTNALVFVDEPAMIMSARGSPPVEFSDLHRLGHKRGVGVAIASHHFSGDLPTFARSAHHRIFFRLAMPEDQDVLRGIVGKPATQWISTAPDHHFYYKGTGGEGASTPIPIGKPSRTGKPKTPEQVGVGEAPK